jgi:hypothetical protein
MQQSKTAMWLLTLALVMAAECSFAEPGPPAVPDVSNSALLLSVGLAGLAAIRKLMR